MQSKWRPSEVRFEQDAPGGPAHEAGLAKAQEEAAREVVEASAGGGMATVKANGAGEVVSITIGARDRSG